MRLCSDWTPFSMNCNYGTGALWMGRLANVWTSMTDVGTTDTTACWEQAVDATRRSTSFLKPDKSPRKATSHCLFPWLQNFKGLAGRHVEGFRLDCQVQHKWFISFQKYFLYKYFLLPIVVRMKQESFFISHERLLNSHWQLHIFQPVKTSRLGPSVWCLLLLFYWFIDFYKTWKRLALVAMKQAFFNFLRCNFSNG